MVSYRLSNNEMAILLTNYTMAYLMATPQQKVDRAGETVREWFVRTYPNSRITLGALYEPDDLYHKDRYTLDAETDSDIVSFKLVHLNP